MKVAYLLGSLNRGGTETLLLDVFKSAESAPYEFIGIHRKGGVCKEEFYAAGPKMFHCEARKFRWISYLLRLRRLLKKEHVTIMHAQQSIDCIYAWLASIGTGIRIVETFHGYDYESGWFDRLINHISIVMADAVCFVSAAEREYYKQAYHLRNDKKLHVVYNGVDFVKLSQDYPVPGFLKETAFEERIINSEKRIADDKPERQSPLAHKIRLAMVGNFVRGRSQIVICRALRRLIEQGVTDFDFYFVGKRDEAEPWRHDNCVRYCWDHKMNNWVHFVGGRSDVPAILQNIDGFMYSTEHDTFGIAVVEALAAGVPVVVNDWEVMREITHGGEWATLFRTDSPEDCAIAIRELMENLPERKERAKQIAVEVRSEYSIQKHIDALYQVYKQL